ncbi:2-dehydropantoate 2-reductase N-terminal domain-containing protein [soil metagenome]
MRYVVFGAGAIGGVVGGRLAEHGRDVVFVARGAHLDALRADGLLLRSPDGDVRVPAIVTGSITDVGVRPDDIVLLTVKGQDTVAALDAVVAAVPDSQRPPALVCAQNGVENERLALRRFPDVYGMVVVLPATHLEPGVVVASSAPVTGMLDLGRIPTGADDLARRVAADLSASTFSSRAVDDVLRVKRRKLLLNLGNALEAAAGPGSGTRRLYERARDEALACFGAAGLEVASAEEDRARREGVLDVRPVDGERRGGGSTWQSLARASGSVEVDLLNGEIVLLGRLHGVPTPVNELLQRVAWRLARSGAPPGSVTARALEAELAGG